MGKANFLYNPGRKAKTQLIEEFVIRQHLLDIVVEDIVSSTMKTPEQHYLLIGQRGTGKTTLLHRIRYAIEDAPGLRDWLIPLVFSEEQYNIGELANLWEHIGQLLEDYHGFEGLYGEMEKNSMLSGYDERCWDILESALDIKKKKLVLLIDNIGDMLEKLPENEIRRIRRILQTKSQIRLIAASPLYLDSILDYKQPLFEFFKVLRLENLDIDETHSLLLKLADIHNERPAIERIIRENPERIETLRTLTGGVPRTIALMFNIFIEHKHEGSLKDLEIILDAVTPLYKHRMDDLPPQQQKIVDAVARHWDPINVKTLKERLRLESKVISAQLRQLEKDQVVQKLETGTKNHEYIIRERFFNIWYLMRYGRRDDKQRVVWLVRFLENWCTDEDLEKRIADFTGQIKVGGITEDDKEFFAQVYSSLSHLNLRSKMILEESAVTYETLQFSEEEINKAVKESFAEGDYERAYRWMIRLPRLTDEIKGLVFEDILRNNEYNERGNLLLKSFEDDVNHGVASSSVKRQLILLYVIAYSSAFLPHTMESEKFEDAASLIKSQLIWVVTTEDIPADKNYFSRYSFEMYLILSEMRGLVKQKQFHALRSIFSEEPALAENNKRKLSEVYNPIYLALNSLDPEARKINIAPEKEAIVRSIRDFITKKD